MPNVTLPPFNAVPNLTGASAASSAADTSQTAQEPEATAKAAPPSQGLRPLGSPLLEAKIRQQFTDKQVQADLAAVLSSMDKTITASPLARHSDGNQPLPATLTVGSLCHPKWFNMVRNLTIGGLALSENSAKGKKHNTALQQLSIRVALIAPQVASIMDDYESGLKDLKKIKDTKQRIVARLPVDRRESACAKLVDEHLKMVSNLVSQQLPKMDLCFDELAAITDELSAMPHNKKTVVIWADLGRNIAARIQMLHNETVENFNTGRPHKESVKRRIAFDAAKEEGKLEDVKAAAGDIETELVQRMPQAWQQVKVLHERLLLNAKFTQAKTSSDRQAAFSGLLRENLDAIADVSTLIDRTYLDPEAESVLDRVREVLVEDVNDEISRAEQKRADFEKGQNPSSSAMSSEIDLISSEHMAYQNKVLTLLHDDLMSLGAVPEKEKSRRELLQLADKLDQVALAYSELAEYFDGKLNESSLAESLDTKAQADKVFSELEYRQLLAQASALCARVHADSKPDDEPKENIERKAGGNKVADAGLRAEVRGKPGTGDPTLENLPASVESLRVKDTPLGATLLSERLDLTTGVQPVIEQVQPLTRKADEALTVARKKVGEHKDALSFFVKNSKIEQAIAEFEKAADAFNSAADRIKQAGRVNIGSTSIGELDQQRNTCRQDASFYRAYLASPLSQPLTKESLSTLDDEGNLAAFLPSDTKSFQQFSSRLGDMKPEHRMFEIELRSQFRFDGKDMDRTWYLHIHVNQDDVKLSELALENIVAAHVKTPRQRKMGRSYEDRSGNTVLRLPVGKEFAVNKGMQAVAKASGSSRVGVGDVLAQ